MSVAAMAGGHATPQRQNWTRQPSDVNQTDWLLHHTARLNERTAQWEARGYDV